MKTAWNEISFGLEVHIFKSHLSWWRLKEKKIFCFSEELADNEDMLHMELASSWHGCDILAVLNIVQAMPWARVGTECIYKVIVG